jgi:hypothetical protein
MFGMIFGILFAVFGSIICEKCGPLSVLACFLGMVTLELIVCFFIKEEKQNEENAEFLQQMEAAEKQEQTK